MMQMKIFILSILFLCYFISAQRYALINEPVVDLRRQPVPRVPAFIYDPLQETQLLLNECVNVHRVEGEWTYINSIIQEKRDANKTKWIGYPGYVKTKQLTFVDSCDQPASYVVVKNLWATVYKRPCARPGCSNLDEVVIPNASLGTRFSGCSREPCKFGWCCVKLDFLEKSYGYILQSSVNVFTEKEKEFAPESLRDKITETALSMLGWVYFWGGRSAFHPMFLPQFKQLSGVDCSGLTGLAHQVNHVIIPRDAGDQLAKSINITNVADFKKADLFFEGNAPDKIAHVVMYIGNEEIVESTSGSINSTLIRSTTEVFGKPTKELYWGMTIPNGYKLYWGTFFKN